MNELPENGEIIHDWNRVGFAGPLTKHNVTLLDETLRDGIQSPSAVDPPIEDKQALLRLMDRLGIEYADIGLPGPGGNGVPAIVKEGCDDGSRRTIYVPPTVPTRLA